MKGGIQTRYTLTKCCISAVSCHLTGRYVCDGNKDNRLSSDRVPGEGRGLVDTHSPLHTPPCTGPWLQQAQGVAETHSWGDRRTHSPKTPDLWDRHDLGAMQGRHSGEKLCDESEKGRKSCHYTALLRITDSF